MARIETIRNQQSVVVNVPGQPSIEVRLGALSADIKHRLTIHGLAQKLADAMAMERDAVTGKSAPFAVKHAACARIAQALIAGEWTVKAERVAADAITEDRIAAVAAARGTDRTRIAAWLETLTAERRVQVFGHPSVAVELARIRAERAAAGADPDADPFQGLDGDAPDEDDTAPM